MPEIKERPILFSGPMVRAILDGRKTVTRRVAKPVRHPDLGNIYAPGALVLEKEPQHVIDRACPFGQPGDRLWVRETWQGPLVSSDEQEADPSWFKDMKRYQDPTHCAYRAADDDCEYFDPDGNHHCRWRPSIHMPRWASRILLEVTDVRVERLQDITYEQAAAEGIHRDHRMWFATDEGGAAHRYPREAFRDLWIKTGGDWDANPWVWCIEFKRIQP